MSSQPEPNITSAKSKLEFNNDGKLISVTYVNPTTQELIISKVNPETGEISSPNTIEGELEFNNDGGFTKIIYPRSNNNNSMLLSDNASLERSQISRCVCWKNGQGILCEKCPCP
jgi:hypothetical protein